MSFAVIHTGGKQYKVEKGDTLRIEKLSDLTDGKVVFDKVLLVDDGTTTKVGAPYITGATVSATVLVEEGKGKKVLVIKYRPKSRYFKKNGHRQPFTEVKIDSIN